MFAPVSSVPPPGVAPSTRSPRRLASRWLLGLWGVTAMVVSAYLLGSHLATMPTPRNDQLASAVGAYAAEAPASGVVVVHVLYEACRCSQKLVSHLVERGRAPDRRELVVLVADGEDDPERSRATLRSAGYDVRVVSSADLTRQYGVEAAPLLVVAEPSGVVRYVGGYTDRKQSPMVRDDEIAAKVARGVAVSALPLFGCAVSAELRTATDPLGVLR